MLQSISILQLYFFQSAVFRQISPISPFSSPTFSPLFLSWTLIVFPSQFLWDLSQHDPRQCKVPAALRFLLLFCWTPFSFRVAVLRFRLFFPWYWPALIHDATGFGT